MRRISVLFGLLGLLITVSADNGQGWGSRANPGYIEVIAESQGVYPNADVFNIGNVGAIFTETPVTPSEFESMRQSALAWFEERFGLFSTSNSFSVYNPETFVTSIQSNSDPTQNLGNVLGQIFNSNYSIVSTNTREIPLGSTVSIVEVCFYPQPVLYGTPIGGTYGVFVTSQGGTPVYHPFDSYCVGTYFVFGNGDTNSNERTLIRTIQEKASRPLRSVEGQTLLSEENYLFDSEFGRCTSQIQLYNIAVVTNTGVELSNRIQNHWFCPGDSF